MLGGGPASASILTAPSTTSGPSISGGALDFGSRGGESGHHSSKTAVGSSVLSGISSSASAGSGVGSAAVSAAVVPLSTGSAAGSTTGGAGTGAGGAIVGGAGTTATALTSGSLHPLHFNWVFWFMHRAPGSKILNYESSMKKIATFGSVSVPSDWIPSAVDGCPSASISSCPKPLVKLLSAYTNMNVATTSLG
jgi:hypothetical protein